MANAEPSPFDPRTATASDIQTLLQASEVTSVQLIEIYLKQIELYNGYLKAVISTAPKSDLLEKAKKLDAERSQGKMRSRLHGIPVLVKARDPPIDVLSILMTELGRTILQRTSISGWTPPQAA